MYKVTWPAYAHGRMTCVGNTSTGGAKSFTMSTHPISSAAMTTIVSFFKTHTTWPASLDELIHEEFHVNYLRRCKSWVYQTTFLRSRQTECRHALQALKFMFCCDYGWIICAGDCHSSEGIRDVCVAGAINNFTGQLQAYAKDHLQTESTVWWSSPLASSPKHLENHRSFVSWITDPRPIITHVHY